MNSLQTLLILNIISILILLLNALNILCDDSNEDFLKNCGQRPRSGRMTRIIGGSDSFYGEVPWQVLLRVNVENGVMQCGAVLIDKNWILTAAHCIQTKGTLCKDIKAFFGKHKLEDNGKTGTDNLKKLFDDQNNSTTISSDNSYIKWLTNGYNNQIVTRNASKVIVNEEFNSNTFENDIALIKLNQSIQIEDNIQPICLPQQMQDFSGQTGHVSGFGVIKYGSKVVPRVLQIVSVPILTTDHCKYLFEQLGHNHVIQSGKLCAGIITGGRDACAGDSGGPLTVKSSENDKWILAGIISNGIKCGQPNLPGVYTQVSAYVNWINRVIKSDNK